MINYGIVAYNNKQQFIEAQSKSLTADLIKFGLLDDNIEKFGLGEIVPLLEQIKQMNKIAWHSRDHKEIEILEIEIENLKNDIGSIVLSIVSGKFK